MDSILDYIAEVEKEDKLYEEQHRNDPKPTCEHRWGPHNGYPYYGRSICLHDSHIAEKYDLHLDHMKTKRWLCENRRCEGKCPMGFL